MTKPRIALPVPTSRDEDYNGRNWPVFAAAIEAAGGKVVRIPLDLGDDRLARVADGCAGIVLPGSLFDVDPAVYNEARDARTAGADLDRERTDRFLIEKAVREGKPLLGVCYGAQMLNVVFGGRLTQDLNEAPVAHAQPAERMVHLIEVAAGSVLSGLVEDQEAPGRLLPVNSSHHQAVSVLGAGLRLAAWSPQDGVIEAFEGDGTFLMGVQWHPERTVGSSAASRALFGRLVRVAAGGVNGDTGAG